MAWLLDTNILSELRRLRPDPKVLAFIASCPLEQLYIRAVTLAELRFGIELLSKGASRRDELNHWLTHTIRPMFDERVLPIHGRHHVQVAGSGRRRPKDGPHVSAAGPD
jgi:predicted nucleic acid-binding protein